MFTASDDRRSAALIRRVRAEYLEMPGLRLTAGQAQRLFGLTAGECELVLTTLLHVGFLSRAPDGLFRTMRASGEGA